MAKSKGALTEAQEKQIKGIKPAAPAATPASEQPAETATVADSFVAEMEAAKQRSAE
jgi:hypothetical protein